jgi:hypothetical protein
MATFFNIAKKLFKKSGLGSVESLSSVASSGSVSGAVAAIAKRKMAKKFEGLLVETAITYASGYTSRTMAQLGQAGVSAGVAGALFASLKLIGYLNNKKEKEDRSDAAKFGAVLAPLMSMLVFAMVFMLINVVRKQKMFSTLAGGNMTTEYAKFFGIPLAVLFVILRVMIPSDQASSTAVLALASSLSGVVVYFARKFYFVYKLNVLEKNVFETLTDVFEKCKDTAECGHEHAGFLKVFNGVDSQRQRNMKMIFGDIDYASITREISKSQKFDTLRALTG